MALDTSPQQVTTTALQALPFESLIGGPLKAAISAQALAAKTTWEFIKEVGLWDDPKTGEKKAVNVTFMYQKGGEMVNLVVPLLTIVPIPYIAVDEITIDFLANISASASNVQDTTTSESLTAGGGGSARVGWGPFSLNVNFNANYSSKKDSRSTQESRYSVEYTMNVRVAASQSSMPAGLGAVLNILQGAITEAKPGGGIDVSPKSFVMLQRSLPSSQTVRFVVKNSHGEPQSDQEVTINVSAPTSTSAYTAKSGTTDLTLGSDVKLKTDAAGGVDVTITLAASTTSITSGEGVSIRASAVVENPATGPGTQAPASRTVTGASTGTLTVPASGGGGLITMTANPNTVSKTANSAESVEITVMRGTSPVSGQIVNATSADNAKAAVTASATTDANGKATLSITPKQQASTTVTISTAGANSLTITVTGT